MAAYAALVQHAAAATAPGDERSRGRLMADELVARLTTAAGHPPVALNLDIQLVMTDRTLLTGDHEPTILTGYGAIPATLARRLVRHTDDAGKVWVRRLYLDSSGTLADADPRRRLFPKPARDFLIARDQTCRTPWCGAPIRHADHIRPHADGGQTTVANAPRLVRGLQPAQAACRLDQHHPAGRHDPADHPERPPVLRRPTSTAHRAATTRTRPATDET